LEHGIVHDVQLVIFPVLVGQTMHLLFLNFLLWKVLGKMRVDEDRELWQLYQLAWFEAPLFKELVVPIP